MELNRNSAQKPRRRSDLPDDGSATAASMTAYFAPRQPMLSPPLPATIWVAIFGLYVFIISAAPHFAIWQHWSRDKRVTSRVILAHSTRARSSWHGRRDTWLIKLGRRLFETVLVFLAMDQISSESLPESGATRSSPLQETSNAATEISASRPPAVGEKFATFTQLDERMSRYSVENCVRLWEREALTIEAARKRVVRLG